MTPARMRGAALATIVLIAGAGVAQTETAREDPALARAWFEVPVPGGVAALAQAAGLDPATERWRLLPDLTRRLHAPFGDRTGPRVVAQLTALLAPADRRHQAGGAALLVAAGGRVPALSPLATTASPRPALPGTDDGDGGGLLLAPAPAAAAVAAPTTSAGEERLPVPLTPEAWRRILGHDRATRAPRDLLATVVIDPRAARLLRGLLALDLTTLATLSGEPDTLREIARRQPDAFATFSASFRVQDGRVFVPGGHPEAARWQELVGASVMKPAEFLRRLAFADEGRLFYFYDSLDRLDDAHRRFALSAAEPAPRSAERTRALRAVFAAAEPWWLETRPPLSRPVADAARVLQVARVTPEGRLAPPGARVLWEAVFDDQATASAEWRARLAQSPPADAAWLAERIAGVEPNLGRSRLATLAFGQRVFGAEAGPAADPEDLLLALRGFARYRALALTLERLQIRDPALHAAAARVAERLDEAGHGDRARASLAAFQGALALLLRAWEAGTLDSPAAAAHVRTLLAVPLADGRYGDGMARWIEEDLLPAFRERLGLPPSTGAEAVAVRAMAGRLPGTPPRLEWEGLAYDVDPAEAEHDRLRRIRRRQGTPTLEAALAAPAAEREERLAAVLTDLVYAAALGPAEDTPAAVEDVARRHEFGFEEAPAVGAPRPGWALAREAAGPGERWHARGALLGLDVALARLVLHRTDAEVPPAPLFTAADRRAFAEGVVLLRARDLDEASADEIAAGLARGRARLRVAAADPAALGRLLAELGVRDWRRAVLPWLAAREPGALEPAFTFEEILWLGGGATVPPAWGTSARAEDGCLCVGLAPPAALDSLAGRTADGRLAALAPDLHLRVAELLSEMRLPARLAPAILALAVQDLVDKGGPAYVDDRLAVARFARGLTRTRMEDYVAALAGRGPLRPEGRP